MTRDVTEDSSPRVCRHRPHGIPTHDNRVRHHVRNAARERNRVSGGSDGESSSRHQHDHDLTWHCTYAFGCRLDSLKHGRLPLSLVSQK